MRYGYLGLKKYIRLGPLTLFSPSDVISFLVFLSLLKVQEIGLLEKNASLRAKNEKIS